MSCKQNNCKKHIIQQESSPLPQEHPRLGELYKLPYEDACAILKKEAEKTATRSFKEGLVYIMRVLDVSPIIFQNENGEEEEASNLVFANVGYRDEEGNLVTSWGAAILKSQLEKMNVGQQCVVYTHDAVPPEEDERFAFLKKWKGRIKMQRLKGVASEVLVLPISDAFPQLEEKNFIDGQDVTVMSGTLKFEKPLRGEISGEIVAHFPPEIEKSDEELFQSESGRKALRAMHGRNFYATIKYDGTSGTVVFRPEGALIKDNRGSIVKTTEEPEFLVCSRNYQLARSSSDSVPAIWRAVLRYNLDKKLMELNRHIAIQFEVGGPNIQKNPMGWKELDLRVFTIKDLVTGNRLPYAKMNELCKELEIPMAEIAEITLPSGETTKALDIPFDATWSDDTIRKMAEGFYPNTNTQREGVVFRTMENDKMQRGGYISFKSINLKYKG